MSSHAGSVRHTNEARCKVAFNSQAVFAGNVEWHTIDLAEKRLGDEQVIIRHPDGFCSNTILLADVLVGRRPNAKGGLVWQGQSSKWEYDTLTDTVLLLRIPKKVFDSLAEEVRTKSHRSMSIPDVYKEAFHCWLPVRTSEKLGFTVASESGRLQRLHDFEAFMDKAEGCFIADVGIEISLFRQYNDNVAFETTLVDVHLRDVSTVSAPRVVFELSHVATDFTPSKELLKKIEKAGLIPTSKA